MNKKVCFVKTVFSAVLGNGARAELCSEEILSR
jgi:hypothetical protein